MTKERYEEINKRIKELEEDIFLIQMIDTWTTKDSELFDKYNEELQELKKQIVDTIFK